MHGAVISSRILSKISISPEEKDNNSAIELCVNHVADRQHEEADNYLTKDDLLFNNYSHKRSTQDSKTHGKLLRSMLIIVLCFIYLSIYM